MPQDDTLLRIVYENSGEENQIPLSDLVAALTGFLDHFAEKSLVGEPFFTPAGIVTIPRGFSQTCSSCWEKRMAHQRFR
jgi:hypothetical protein